MTSHAKLDFSLLKILQFIYDLL
jgi:hypothetical protein